MLSFVDALKQIIANVQATGGVVIERSFPSHQLLQQLREYAVQRLAETPRAYLLDDWFTEGYFDEYVRVCVVYLQKLGISDEDRIYRLLTKVIDSAIREGRGEEDYRKQKDFEKHLAFSLKEIWDNIGDEQTYLYTVAQGRWLIAWDYQESRWKAASLGRMFMELSPFQAAIFFLSIDTLFATGKRDFRHISSDVLRHLQSPQPDPDSDELEFLPYHYRNLLTRLGILFQDSRSDPLDHFRLTPIGQTVLRAALSEDNPFRDTALAIIRTEEVGGTFNESASEINEIFHLVLQW